MQQPTSGTVVVSGNTISGMSDRALRPLRGHFGFVFQGPASSLNPRMSIGQCVVEPLTVQTDMSPQEVDAKVRSLLDSVELPGGYAERFPHELSGGQQQRVAIARAVALGPDLLIADEPNPTPDVSVQARVLELFLELQHQLQFACLFISHDLADVDSLANRVAVMQNGKLIEVRTREQVLGDPHEE